MPANVVVPPPPLPAEGPAAAAPLPPPGGSSSDDTSAAPAAPPAAGPARAEMRASQYLEVLTPTIRAARPLPTPHHLTPPHALAPNGHPACPVPLHPPPARPDRPHSSPCPRLYLFSKAWDPRQRGSRTLRRHRDAAVARGGCTQGLRALVKERPDDPLEFMARFILESASRPGAPAGGGRVERRR